MSTAELADKKRHLGGFGRRSVIMLTGALLWSCSHAQERQRVKGIFFPTPMYERNWYTAIGFQTFATPDALTEEFRLRVPAGDVQLMRQIHGGLHLNARALIQILQNHATLGLRWAAPLRERWNISLGADAGWYKGRLDIEGFDTDGNGWSAYPNISIGYEAGRDVLLTLKTEALFTLEHRTRVGDHEIARDINTFNGMAWSLYVEQPFFGNTHIALGFTMRYTDHFWATWALFNTHQKPLLYRHLTIAFIP
jgi:hypothetical protein